MPIYVNYKCLVYRDGEELTLRLFKDEVLYIHTVADLTGTHIMASDPVAVFSGNSRTAVPDQGLDQSSRDHLVEQVTIDVICTQPKAD